MSIIFKEKSLIVWLFLGVTSVVLLGYAHYFLQIYLFMSPCEQCVYIRFAMLLVVLASLFAFLGFKSEILQSLAYALSFWGIFLGIKHSLLLSKIHHAMQENNPFGIDGCSSNPNFPFSLPLDKLYPSLFQPNGICGFDVAFVNAEEALHLSALQRFFIGSVENNFTDGLYSKGWYLVPQFEFMSIASACLIVFSVFALLLVATFCLWGRKRFIYAPLVMLITLALAYLG